MKEEGSTPQGSCTLWGEVLQRMNTRVYLAVKKEKKE
jgi:hypothetical protein